MPLHPIGNLLGATDELKALTARVRRLRELQKLYVGCVPRQLAGSTWVKNLQAGTLLVSADSAAVAAKLRQLAPTLLASLRRIEPEITGVRIGVQVGGAPGERRPKTAKTALTPDAIQEFSALAGRMPKGELKSALTRMVRRHRKPSSRA